MKVVDKKRFIISSIGLALISILIVFIVGFNVFKYFTKGTDEKQEIQKVQQEVAVKEDSLLTSEVTSEKNPEKAEATSGENPSQAGIFEVGGINQLVNKEYKLAADYVPNDLVWMDLPGTRETQMRTEAAAGLTKLFNAAKAEGIELYCCSGYRSYALQDELYQWNVETYGEEEANLVSAKPGTSEHQTGLVMDVTSESVAFDLLESFGDTKEGQFVRDHAHEYGFIIRYPQGKTSSTGYAYEPWHIRYLGVDLATAVKNSGKTLEEYYGL